jgi:hypothetical protein
MVLAFIFFSMAVFSHSVSIASTIHNNQSILEESEDIPIEVVLESDPCDQVTCMDIYPEDGKIEGKTVSQMVPSGINNVGQVVGRLNIENSSNPFAFVREPDGNVWLFRTPSSSGQGEFTDINDTGMAVGFYENDKVQTKIGFLMNSKKQWEADIEYPENPCPKGKSYLHTQPNGINDEGEIVGNYGCTAHPEDAVETLFRGDGFYRSPDGTYFRVQYEDAKRTVAGKISNNGVIVGYYVMDDDVWIPFAAVKEELLRPILRSEGRVR